MSKTAIKVLAIFPLSLLFSKSLYSRKNTVRKLKNKIKPPKSTPTLALLISKVTNNSLNYQRLRKPYVKVSYFQSIVDKLIHQWRTVNKVHILINVTDVSIVRTYAIVIKINAFNTSLRKMIIRVW